MNTTSSPELYDQQSHNTGHATTPINACLSFADCDGYRVIFCRHEILYRAALEDKQHRALLAVTIRQSQLATQEEIASAFGHSVATQRRWETRYLQHGCDGLRGKTPPGRKPHLDHSQHALVRQWFEAGLSNREMGRRLAVSEVTIRRILRQMGLCRRRPPATEMPFVDGAPTPETPMAEPAPTADAKWDADVEAAERDADVEAATPPEASADPPVAAAAAPPQTPTSSPPSTDQAANAPDGFTIDRDPADRSGDRFLARQGLLHDALPLFGDHDELPRAGVLLAVPVLQEHGCLEVFNRLYQSLGPAFYGLRTTVLSLVLLALLRIKRPENVKEYAPEALGRLLGLDRIAEVKTLRRKLTLLAEQRHGHELLMELARARLVEHEDRVAFLYVDGHVREYSGQEKLAKTKKAQRSVATCAATDTWVHDADGEPLLLVTSEMNTGLTRMLDAIVADAQTLIPAGRRLTVLFDRGGWSVKLFARLIAQGVDIITYRKGAKKTLPRSKFVAHRVVEDGREKVYWLHDQPRVRVGRLRAGGRRRRPGVGPQYLWLRQVTVLREDGRQTVIVTNRTDLSAVEVVRRLFRRWRQENFFKYMAEEFALDALVEYGVDDVSESASRPNPERKRLTRERQQVRGEVARLRAQLGAAAAGNEERQRPTMRGFKVAQAGLRRQLAQAELRDRELTEQLRQLPQRVPAKGLKTLKKEKKLIVDAIKTIAYQLETALLGRIAKHYARSTDEGRTLLHAAFQSSARMEVTETELRITIAAQSSPHRSQSLAQLCHELDAEAVHYPGSRLRVRLAVEGQEPLTA